MITTMLLNFLILTSSFATKVSTLESPTTLFDVVRSKYAKYQMVQIDATRFTHIKVLNKKREDKIKIYLSFSGDLRIETLKDPKTITILNKEKALVINEADPFFGGPLRVMVSKNPDLKQSQAFLRIIFGSKNFGDLYKIVGGDQTTIKLAAIKKDLSVQSAEVKFDKGEKVITKITYWDEQKNQVDIVIKNTKFLKTENKELFEFKIPKDAEVTEV